MIKNIFKLFLIGFLSMTILLSGCSQVNTPNSNSNGNINSNATNVLDGSLKLNETDDSIKVFKSKEELISFLKNQNNNLDSYNGDNMNKGDLMVDRAFSESANSIGAPRANVKESSTSSISGGVSASDYSSTNNQVEGVDEADIVKNDGKYIYTLSNNRLVIVDAYPADSAKIVSEIKFNQSERLVNFFINEDKLILFTNKEEKILKVSSYNFVPETNYESKTHLYIFDISDKKNIGQIKDYSINGNFYDARMIGNSVYLISSDYQYYYNSDINVPVLYDGVMRIATPDIYYFNMPYYSQNFNTVTGLNLDTLELDSKSFMLGSSDTLYVSENNIYIAYQKYYRYSQLDMLKDVIIPLLSVEYKNKVNQILDENLNEYQKSDKVSLVLEEMYNLMDEKEKQKLVDNIQEKAQEHYYKFHEERSKSVVHKINIKDGKVEYDTKGEFKGHLLNQFSLDEAADGNLRVATTTSFWARDKGSINYNNVYVLDKNLEVIGSLEKLAEDERIYSTRFIGDKLYMVTFRQVDPLFVIDLADSTYPKVLGKLKIPGYSDYLHPFDENFLIGVGKDTKESEWGGVVNNGVKLSLFDITDFENPKEVDSYIIDGKYSEALVSQDHKAFLFSKEKQLLVLPIREYLGQDNSVEYEPAVYAQSAFVFNVNENGFELKGKITHESNLDNNYYWYNSPSAIKRILYMEDILYTISEKKIIANNLDDLEEIKELDLGYVEPEYDDYPQIYY